MAFSMIHNLLNYYLILTYPFHNVLASSPCDVRQIPFKLQSRDIFSVEKSTVKRPLLQEIVSTTVNLSLSIKDIDIIDVKNLDVELDLIMTQKWYDNRLGPDYKTRKLAVLGGIWQPKITFVVGKRECKCSSSGIQDDQTQFWRGTSNGSVLFSERFLVKPKCTKDLTKYPFDEQTCFLKIGSYRFTAEEVILEWNSEMPIELLVDKELGEFYLKKLKSYGETDIRSTGNFSVLVLEINVSRYSRREIIRSFVPSFILVEIAYGILWMKLTEIRTRIFTCQLSLFGMIYLFASSNNYALLNSTYLKALDIWFLICMLFALLPLAETVLINYSNKLEGNFETDEREFEADCEIKSSKNIAIWIEKILRLLHPIGLLISTILFIVAFNNNNDEHN